jgi:PAS domain S-box-containing protein
MLDWRLEVPSAKPACIWVELLHPDDRERILEAHDRHNETGEPWRREYRLIAADGRTVWVRDQAVLLRDADGRPLTWQGLLLDATPEKEAEERRRAAHEELEFRVRARTSQLADANELMSLEIGERRRVERELLAAKERYRRLVEDLPAVIYMWQTRERPDGADESYVSPQVEDLLGFTPAEWHADWGVWKRRLHPHDRDRIVAATEHTARTGEPFQEEFRYLAKDGRIVWVLDRATLLERDERGRPLILQGVTMDITARKLAELKAAEAEERFRELADWSPVSPWAFELTTDEADGTIRVDYVGPAIGQTLGYPVSRWIDDLERWYEMVHPDDRDELRRAMRHHLATGAPWTLDYRMIAADGRLVWVRDRGRCAARDEEGRPARFVGAIADITEDRRRLDEVVAATRSTHAVTEGMPAVAWTEVVDAATGRRRYTYIGPQAREVFGYDAAELIAEPRHFERMLHPEDRERVLATWDLHDETGEPWDDEFRVRLRDGRVRWFHSVARRVTGPDAAAAVWHGVSIDVTDARERLRPSADAEGGGGPVTDGRGVARS